MSPASQRLFSSDNFARKTSIRNEADIADQSHIYFPQEDAYRLYNTGRIMLETIGVQTDSCLKEDDISPVSDEFGRGWLSADLVRPDVSAHGTA